MEGGDPTKVIELIDKLAEKAKQKGKQDQCSDSPKKGLKATISLLIAAGVVTLLGTNQIISIGCNTFSLATLPMYICEITCLLPSIDHADT